MDKHENILNAWDLVKEAAEKFFLADTIWKSFIKQSRYQILKIEESRILIQKLNGGKDVILTKGAVNGAVKRLLNENRVKKNRLLYSVSRETTLIHLHPFIHWDSSNKEVYWDSSTSPLDISKLINEVPDDD